MATRKLNISTGVWSFLTVLALWLANYASAKIIGFPFAYCWLGNLVIPIYEPLAGIMHMICMVALIWYGMTRNPRGMVFSGVALVVIFGLPIWADILLRMGGSCGVR